MARREAPEDARIPERTGGSGLSGGRFPGLHESLPLLMFGAAAVIAGAYLALSRAAAFGGHLPLWAYLATLGSIAIAGGLAGSVVGDPMDDLPRAGDSIGEDLLVVPRSEWLELHARADGSLARPPAPRAAPPIADSRPVRVPTRAAVRSPPPQVPAPAAAPAAPAPSAGAVPDWWESALATTTPSDEGRPVFPTGREAAKPVDEVLSTLDSIAVEATPKVLIPETPPIPAAPLPPPGALLHRPARRPPRARPMTTSTEIDLQLDEIARGVGHLLPPPGAVGPPEPAASTAPTPCVRCQNPVASGSTGLECESCGRPLCGHCLDLAKNEGNPGLCQVCAMLLDSAGGA